MTITPLYLKMKRNNSYMNDDEKIKQEYENLVPYETLWLLRLAQVLCK